MGGVRDHRNGAARDRGLRLAASRRPALRFSGRAAAVRAPASARRRSHARIAGPCRALRPGRCRWLRARRRSRSACNSRKGSTPTRAAFQRRAPTMATWPSLLRAKSAPGACRRSTSQPSRWKPANRAGKIRPGHRGGGLRHGLHARFGRRARFQAAMMAITAKGMAANTPMAAYSSGSAAKPPTLSSAAMAALIHQGERSAPRRWNSGAS